MKEVRGEMELILSQAHFRQILEHARVEAPNEACGLLAGREGHVAYVLPATNVAENPLVGYLMDPHDQIRHFQAIEEQGLDLLAIYHSHPVSQAYPSPTDLSMSYYPEVVYAIVSLMRSDHPVLRTFRIVDGQVSEVAFQMIPSEATNSNASALLPRLSKIVIVDGLRRDYVVLKLKQNSCVYGLTKYHTL
jgi:proteasome lid subunit RPN8/RPN11